VFGSCVSSVVGRRVEAKMSVPWWSRSSEISAHEVCLFKRLVLTMEVFRFLSEPHGRLLARLAEAVVERAASDPQHARLDVPPHPVGVTTARGA
jgi:hypothetical protein